MGPGGLLWGPEGKMADAVEPSPAAAAAAGALGELRVESPWSPLRFPVFRWI